jgi:hypothetical protein
MVFLF